MVKVVGLCLLFGLFSITHLSAQTLAYTVERYLQANYPVALAFAPDGRLFYTEKDTGNVRVVSADGTLQPEPVIHLDTSALVERGMLGIALDPDYANNGYIWVFHTAEGTATDYAANSIVRFHEENGIGSEPVTLLSVPITNGELQHNGGNLHFDVDGTLYVSFGDYGDSANAQNLDTIPGKIHHFQVSGDTLLPAEGNPFPDSSIFVYGVRNSFDFDFDPVSGHIFATENGFHCDDEINLILPGFNYGWRPDYECVAMNPVSLERYVAPLVSYTPTEAPTGITFYDHPAIPEWDGQLFFCAWNSGIMRRVTLNDARTQIADNQPVDLGAFGCRIDVEVGPEGAIYFTDPGAIYRLVPQ